MPPIFKVGDIMARQISKTDKILEDCRAQFDRRGGCFSRAGLYGEIIKLIGAEQFNWKNLPETINSHWAERAINTGLAAAYIVPEGISAACKGFTITRAAFVGVPNQIGETDKIIVEGTDYALELDRKTDKVVIIKNNDYLYSEYINLSWFAEMLARTDDSERALIIWSKIHPIAKATTGIEVEMLKEILRGIIEDDDLYNVISDDSKVITGGQPLSRDDTVLRLTDENAVEKMHFLSEFHYELIRRYCTLYNMPFRTTAKSAQSLESELHNTDIFSQVINANRLKCRQAAAEEMNKVFGLKISVDFSELIKKENEIIDSNVKEEVAEAEQKEVAAENEENVSRETSEEVNENGENENTEKEEDSRRDSSDGDS